MFLGRLTGKKASQDILYTLKKLEDEKTNNNKWELTFVGEGPFREKITKIVNNYGWNKKVIFKGNISHTNIALINVYKNADIYILPSKTYKGEKEGIPGTLVEAMASGLPVISTYHAGIPSVIANKNNGFLFNEGDVTTLASYINLLINDVNLREKLGRNAAKKALVELNLYEKTKELEEIYFNLINNNGKKVG